MRWTGQDTHKNWPLATVCFQFNSSPAWGGGVGEGGGRLICLCLYVCPWPKVNLRTNIFNLLRRTNRRTPAGLKELSWPRPLNGALHFIEIPRKIHGIKGLFFQTFYFLFLLKFAHWPRHIICLFFSLSLSHFHSRFWLALFRAFFLFSSRFFPALMCHTHFISNCCWPRWRLAKVDDVDAHGAIIMIIGYSCTWPATGPTRTTATATYKRKL